MRALLILLAFLAVPVPALAGDLVLTIRDKAGAPVPNAVVIIHPASGVPSGPIRFPWPLSVAQQNIQFDPFVLVAPVGASVAFPNKDKVRHHVYSFAPGNRFELKLYGRDESRSVSFDTVGIAAIGCNIHDQMVGFIVVVDTPWAVKTDASGVATIRGVPAGPASVRIWHPYQRAPRNEIERRMTFGAGALRETVAIELRPPAHGMH